MEKSFLLKIKNSKVIKNAVLKAWLEGQLNAGMGAALSHQLTCGLSLPMSLLSATESKLEKPSKSRKTT